MRTRAGQLLANIKPHLTEKAGGIIADLKALGLTISDEDTHGRQWFELDADHRHNPIHDVFLKNGWRLTFNGNVAGGVKQAAYQHDAFGGGNAVLHFKQNKVYFLTVNFKRDYRD
ncbi:MAG: hypothetical protein GY833_12775 [Aestuariibacter sp.]|nr:hypothetical protein [Aestuariibacter sp.]|tara:strand:- start:133747 stop:134091 length:345 start_codon:yes stop_codon:yes gene_type:complete